MALVGSDRACDEIGPITLPGPSCQRACLAHSVFVEHWSAGMACDGVFSIEHAILQVVFVPRLPLWCTSGKREEDVPEAF